MQQKRPGHAVAGTLDPFTTRPARSFGEGIGWWLSRPGPRLRYAAGVAVVVACLGGSWALEQFGLSTPNIVMFFVLAVAVVATGFGTGPSIVAAVLASAMLAFFFLPPRFSLAVSDVQQVIMLVIMSTLAVLISSLTDLVRSHAVAAEQHAAKIEAMFGLSSALAACTDAQSIATAGSRQLSRVFGREVFILLPDDGRLAVTSASGPTSPGLGTVDMAAAGDAFRRAVAAPASAPPSDAAGGFLPMISGTNAVGLVALRPAERLDPDHLPLLTAMSQQVADAIDRERLVRQVRATQVEAERERLRVGLLSSITHDLRTPLAIITGAASSLLDSNLSLSHDSMLALCQNIVDYSQCMGHLVDNLLSMTRIESGFLQLTREMHVLEDVIGAALTHMRSRWGNRPVKVTIPSGLALVPLDAVLFQQVLVNLLENADAYSPAEEPVEISATPTGNRVVIEVCDRGPGLASGEEQRIFEKFFRGQATRRHGQGSGLGLAICDAIVTAHGGTITARNRPGGGLTMHVELPLGPLPSMAPAARGPHDGRGWTAHAN